MKLRDEVTQQVMENLDFDSFVDFINSIGFGFVYTHAGPGSKVTVEEMKAFVLKLIADLYKNEYTEVSTARIRIERNPETEGLRVTFEVDSTFSDLYFEDMDITEKIEE